MPDRAQRPLNNDAAKGADDDLYQNHADDPRPNALYDADGNRKPLDANDPDQAELREEWMDAYKANDGATEETDESGGSPDQVVLPCGQRAQVDPLIFGDPLDLDESDDGFVDEPEPEEEEEPEAEDEPEEEEPPADDAQDEGDGLQA